MRSILKILFIFAAIILCYVGAIVAHAEPAFDVPSILQTGSLCEATSTTALLQYYGFNVTVAQVWADIPKGTVIWEPDGKRIGPDPTYKFALNTYPDGSSNPGFGIYAPGMMNSINTIMQNNVSSSGDTYQVANLTSCSEAGLFQALQDGPLLVWATVDMAQTVVNSATWYITDNNGNVTSAVWNWLGHEHCLVLTGATNDTVYMMDPMKGNTSYSRSEFIQRWKEQGCNALQIKKVPLKILINGYSVSWQDDVFPTHFDGALYIPFAPIIEMLGFSDRINGNEFDIYRKGTLVYKYDLTEADNDKTLKMTSDGHVYINYFELRLIADSVFHCKLTDIDPIQITVNGLKVVWKDNAYPSYINGNLYVPLDPIIKLLGLSWKITGSELDLLRKGTIIYKYDIRSAEKTNTLIVGSDATDIFINYDALRQIANNVLWCSIAQTNPIQILVNGYKVPWHGDIPPEYFGGTLYVPLDPVLKMLGMFEQVDGNELDLFRKETIVYVYDLTLAINSGTIIITDDGHVLISYKELKLIAKDVLWSTIAKR